MVNILQIIICGYQLSISCILCSTLFIYLFKFLVFSSDELDEHLLNELVAQGSLDFDSWITLITSYEHMYYVCNIY